MSRHRAEGYFRSYPQLWKMLNKETGHQTPEDIIRAKESARTILIKIALDHPRADFVVLYVTRDRTSWAVVPVGIDEEIHNIIQAQRKTLKGKTAVAYSEVK